MFELVESRRSLTAGQFGPWLRLLAANFALVCLVVTLTWLSAGENASENFELESVHRKDFLSASAARKDLDSYWATLDEQTKSLDSQSKEHAHRQQLEVKESKKVVRATTVSQSVVGQGKPSTIPPTIRLP